MIFSFLYFLVGLFLYLSALPVLLVLPFFSKYKNSVPSRFFLYKNPSFSKKGIWFHACSLGEVKALEPLVRELNQNVNLSVITNTGYDAVGDLFSQKSYLPFEIFLPFWVTEQKALIVMEAELWYMLFLMAKQNRAKTYLINARISDRSYARYLRFRWFYKKVFKNIDKVFAQSPKDEKRLRELGAKNVEVIGNIKAYQKISVTKKILKPKKELIVLASTHEDEEELILKDLSFKNRVIAVVPRHPQRFEKVDKILQNIATKNSLTYHKFSEREDFGSDIVLVDKMGELINIYAISDTVLLGGSFVDNIGGHNPLEPAFFGIKLISGKSVFNQEVLFGLVDHVAFCDAKDIEKSLKNLKPAKINSKPDIKKLLSELSNVV